ncbi:MAG: DUF4919 domain-containing protein [Deltaproteobacteria bacterium]|nr:DUF4919 domain-containing protein [Deltaproteobacteria bacterium]
MSFDDLLLDAVLDPSRTDFTALREAWLERDGPERAVWDEEAFEELHMRLATKDWDGALDLADELLETHPLAVELRLWRAQALAGSGDRREANIERAIANGLLKAVLSSGDGESADSPLVVLCAREERLVLNLMGLRAVRSALGELGGRWIDEVLTSDIEGHERVLFFHLRVPERWINPR